MRIYGGARCSRCSSRSLLIWFVSRAVVRPVRKLTAAHARCRRRQLPRSSSRCAPAATSSVIQPVHIEVQSEDEIGELAQAFNDVEAVTLQVAQEQSVLLRKGMGDLFVNLARRNQSLVQRQLELLDDLERNEHDPAALDALFKLDHMATRMRRNAESLLVLSGAEQPRQWQQPIALIDVVRAAAAEIADFPRVELVGIDDDLAVSGRAVSDVAHLLAELLENATSFSPPDTAGRRVGRGVRDRIRARGLRPGHRHAARPHRRGEHAARQAARRRPRALARPRPPRGRRRSRPATASASSCDPVPAVGLVALVALPTAILEPRPVPARRSGRPLPQPGLLAPNSAPDGEADPLGARRLVWRPPDEPPVEEWRGEGSWNPRPRPHRRRRARSSTSRRVPEPGPIVVEPVDLRRIGPSCAGCGADRDEPRFRSAAIRSEPPFEGPLVEAPAFDAPAVRTSRRSTSRRSRSRWSTHRCRPACPAST